MRGIIRAIAFFGVIGHLAADTFSDWDRDGNGQLAREEIPERLRGNFDKVDADGSGWISRKEHEAVLGRGRARGEDAGAEEPIPEGYRAIFNQAYAGTENPAQRLDLYLPEAKSDKALPLLVFIHGGAWRSGSKRGGGGRCHDLDPEGKFVYASVEYRLTGEAGWPAQIHDCKAAIRWLRGNADKYGIDPERVGVFGTSAGGHLVTMLGVSGGVEELEGELGEFDEMSSRVSCVVNYFGPSNLVSMADQPSKMDHKEANSPEGRLVGGAIRENLETARAASPVTYVSEDDAPTLTSHGTEDSIVPFAQGVELDAALKKAGVTSYLVALEGGEHGSWTHELRERVGVFLDRYLVGNEEAVKVSEEVIQMK